MAQSSEQSRALTPMKFLFVCGAGMVSGKEVATLNLMRGLSRRGHEVHCIASTWSDGNFAARLTAQNVPHLNLPLGFISKQLSWSAIWMTLDQLRCVPRLWLGFRRYRRAFKPDVVMQSNFHHIFLLWPVLDSGNTFFHVHDDFAANKFYGPLFRFLSKRLRAFIGVSQYIAERLVRLGIPPGKVCVVHNGVAIDETPDGQAQGVAAAVHRRSNSEAAVKLGIVGQIGPWKGHDDLIEALRELKGAGVPFNCTIFGTGEPIYVAALTEKIERYGLADSVSQAGFVERPRDIYTAIDVCVAPSRVPEAFGMVAAEAAYFGVPVVAARRGGLPEIVQDGLTGYLVDAEAPQQLAEKLRVLVTDTALRERMGRAARQHAQQHFSQDRLAAKFEALLSRALAPGNSTEDSLHAVIEPLVNPERGRSS